MTKQAQSKTKKTEENNNIETAARCWNHEKMVNALMNGSKSLNLSWSEKGLRQLVDEIVNNYETFGGMDHLEGKDLPSKKIVIEALEDLLTIFFPGYIGKTEITKSNIKYFLGSTLASVQTRLTDEVEKSLKYICRKIKECPHDVCRRRAQVVVKELLEKIPELRSVVSGDIVAAYDGDPAAVSAEEVIISYPCVLAITTHRIAHELYLRGVPLIPRIMSEHVHSLTGIDIHPGARIGKNFFIDHGTGVVVGETAEIGDNVKIYQGVTLGALSFKTDGEGNLVRGQKRHPTLEDRVVVYANATILGGATVVGHDAVVGSSVWLTQSVSPFTTVALEKPKLKMRSEMDTA